jgi:calcium-translocating P-type ATPase
MQENDQTTPWYQLTVTEVKKILETDSAKGLDQKQILKRQARYGKNTFESGIKTTLLDRILKQFKSPLVFILLLATIATFFLKEFVDMWVIIAALGINLVIGVIQEKRADDAFEQLTASQEKFATVIRDGQKMEVHAEDLVPGDIVLLETGSRVPADLRIVNAHGLMVNESPLTGEWEDVTKKEGTLKKEARITEQTNMLWMGTLVTKGTAKAIVISIGLKTQIGFIADELAKTQDELIPLQKNIQKLSNFLSMVILVAIVLILIAGLVHGNDPVEMVILALAVAVAAMPEGLPAAVTVVLALGMENILKRGGLVRHILAAETLGNTTVILTDKTGTITQAKMRIADIKTERSIYHKEGKTPLKDTLGEHDKKDVLSMILLTSEGYVEGEQNALGEWVVHGGPIERAVIYAGLESGLRQQDLLEQTPRLDFLPFSSERRFVASLHRHGTENSNKRRVYIAGAPEYLLEKAQFIYSEGAKKKMSATTRDMISNQQLEESKTGMRIVGVGYAELSEVNKLDESDPSFIDTLMDKCVFAGLVVLHDPVREDVKDSILTAHKAGATVIMMTGDNPVTALKIAEEVGIVQEGAQALTGDDVEKLDDDELTIALHRRRVFARVLPQQKLRIARLLKSHGEVIAMTGDGINDAPALRNADIGIALGSGTDVAKESSDLILLNDSFSIIVAAIEEGRRIRDNLKKIIAYLLSTSFSEILLIGAALITGSPIPLLARQILWINILQEGFMNFAFAFEPKEPDVMLRDPRDPGMKEILTKELKKLIALIAIITGSLLVVLYFVMLHLEFDIQRIQTIMFISLSVSSIFYTMSIKNLHAPVWKINPFSNKYLLVAFLASFGGLIFALEFAPLRDILSLQEVTSTEYGFLLGVGVFNLIAIEAAKYVAFRKKK